MKQPLTREDVIVCLSDIRDKVNYSLSLTENEGNLNDPISREEADAIEGEIEDIHEQVRLTHKALEQVRERRITHLTEALKKDARALKMLGESLEQFTANRGWGSCHRCYKSISERVYNYERNFRKLINPEAIADFETTLENEYSE